MTEKTGCCRGKLIVSDIDGTFKWWEPGLRPGEIGISPRNIEALSRFRAEGGRFTFATGRISGSLEQVVPGFREYVNAPVIGCNGAYIYDPETESFPVIRPVDSLYVLRGLSRIHELYPQLTMWIHTVGQRIPLFAHRPDFTLDGWCKAMVSAWTCGEPANHSDPLEEDVGALNEARGVLEALYGDTVAFSKSCPQLLELLDPEATKGKMIAPLKEVLSCRGFETDTVYAVGDYENDLELLSYADVKACPDNAIDAVKEKCGVHLVKCSDGAIGDLIDKIMNGEC